MKFNQFEKATQTCICNVNRTITPEILGEMERFDFSGPGPWACARLDRGRVELRVYGPDHFQAGELRWLRIYDRTFGSHQMFRVLFANIANHSGSSDVVEPTPQDILEIQNVEVRRLLFEVLGREWLENQVMSLPLVDDSLEGQLFNLDNYNLLRVHDPDTDKWHILRVQGHARTVRDAAAWTFGLRGEEYAQVQENRQGDILLLPVDVSTWERGHSRGTVLARGEATGHKHKLDDEDAENGRVVEYQSPHGRVTEVLEVDDETGTIRTYADRKFKVMRRADGSVYVVDENEQPADAKTVTVVHDEHAPLTVPTGTYEIRHQRELNPLVDKPERVRD